VSTTFERFLDVMLPCGGYLVVEVETYFDESGSHKGSPILCVAGYIMEKNNAIKLGDAWRAVLKEHKLPFFRMSDCAHGNGPFSGMTRQHRVEVEAMMIGIIKRYTLQGLAVTVKPDEFEQLMPKFPLIGGIYSFCAHVLLGGVYTFLEAQKALGIEKVAYFFEAGHASKSEANSIITKLFSQPQIKADYCYAGHGFVLKEDTPAVQAADLLAWQWFTDKRHQTEGRPRRKDCISLLEHRHDATHIGPDQISSMTGGMIEDLKEKANVSETEALMLLHYGGDYVRKHARKIRRSITPSSAERA
jgi:Protein of unknown function (DUF3800)